MISFFAWVEDIALKDDYCLQLRAATRHSKAGVDFIDYDTVATKWKSVADLRHTELAAATKATAEATWGARGCAWRGRRRRRCRCACAAEKCEWHRRSCGRRHDRGAGGKSNGGGERVHHRRARGHQ